MNEVFRLPRKQLFVGLACAVFFAAMAAFVLGICLSNDTRKPLPWPGVLIVIVAGEAFWLSWLATALYGLAAYWREELHIEGAQLRFRGVLRTATLDLAAVTQARWRYWPSASLTLRSGAERLKIHFHYDDSKRLMEHLHAQIPYQVQVDWPLFHHHHLRPRVIGPDRVLIDRKRIDRYAIPAALIFFTVVLVCGIWVGFLKATVGACIGAVFLIGFRYLIPKKGFHDETIQAALGRIRRDEPAAMWMMAWLVLALVVMIALAAAERWFHLVLPFRLQMTGLAILGIGFVAILACGARRGYIREKKRKAQLETEWNAEHASV